MGPGFRAEIVAGDPSDLGVTRRVDSPPQGLCREKGPASPSPSDPDKGPVDVTKCGGGNELGEKHFCGVWWEEKPDLLCVEKSVGGEEVEKAG